MRILIVEDDLASRKFLYKFLSQYGDCDITVDGVEALEAYMISVDEEKKYDLICLDIMMPKLDGLKVLKTIREIEKERRLDEKDKTKIIMMTALNDTRTVADAFQYGCEAYAAKPIDMEKLKKVIEKLGIKRV